MRRNFTCPICDTFVETEMDDDGYAVCPKCENTTRLEDSIGPKLHIEKLEARISELEGRIAKAKGYLQNEMGEWLPVETLFLPSRLWGLRQALDILEEGENE